jgi:hypothetical protein
MLSVVVLSVMASSLELRLSFYLTFCPNDKSTAKERLHPKGAIKFSRKNILLPIFKKF